MSPTTTPQISPTNLSSLLAVAHDSRDSANDTEIVFEGGQALPQAYAPLQKCLQGALDIVNTVSIPNSPTLDQQVEDFCVAVEKTTAPNKYYVEWIVKQVEKTTQALWPKADVKPYGSYVTGLSLPSSDLDLVISNVEMSNVTGALSSLAESLAKQSWVVPHTVNPITSAKVPVIKMKCLPTTAENAEAPAREVVVDITFTSDGFLPKHTGVDAAVMLLKFFPSYPLLKLLAMVLKQFLFVQSLHDTYKGGLSSFCLVIMIASYLQAQRIITPADAQPHTVSSLLLGFLDFYGCQFDYKTTGIRVVKADAKDQSTLRFFSLKHESHTLFIEDPFDPSNNIGQSVFQMWRIALAFKQAFHTLKLSYSLDLLTNGAPDPLAVQNPVATTTGGQLTPQAGVFVPQGAGGTVATQQPQFSPVFQGQAQHQPGVTNYTLRGYMSP